MKRTLLVTLFMAMLSALAIGQTPQAPCPEISMDAPGPLHDTAPEAKFRLLIQGWPDEKSLKFVWLVSSGSIIGGQGTKEIRVRRGNIGDNLTATVNIAGLPERCADSVTETVAQYDYAITLSDEYPTIPWKDEVKRLDKFILALPAGDDERSVVVIKIRSNQSFASVGNRVRRIVKHLQTNGLGQATELMIQKAKEEMTSLYIWPTGKFGPTCERGCKRIDVRNISRAPNPQF
jgi:hypothetical protein